VLAKVFTIFKEAFFGPLKPAEGNGFLLVDLSCYVALWWAESTSTLDPSSLQ